MPVSLHFNHFIDLTIINLHTNPYNLAFVNLGPQLYDYTSTPKQEVSVLSLGGGYYFIYLFIYLFI